MSTELLLRGIASVIFSLMFALVVYTRYDSKPVQTDEERCAWRPVIHGALLPAFLLLLPLVGVLGYGVEPTAGVVLTTYFGIIPHISLYYLLLLPALPFLRRHISARACAVLWLLPNFLYLTVQSYMMVPRPLLILHAPGRVVTILAWVWLAGFLVVLLWKIASHFRFRRAILRRAVPVADQAVLEILQDEEKLSRLKKPKYRLVRTPDVTTPLTIGLWERRSVIVLPQRNYGPEELRLIFRHELIHIARRDSWAKFFMVFCAAMCWWNPLIWMAMKKSAEDVELSCDEMVLLEAEDEERHRYANLILRTAGDERGFSTCLSASASALRYRLKSIVRPGRRRTGALVVGAAFFVLCMTSGYVALAYGEETAAATVFGNQDPAAFTADHITVQGGQYEPDRDFVDLAALSEYIAGLRTQEMTGNYSYSDDERYVSVWYQGPDGVVVTDLYTDHLRVLDLYAENCSWKTYHLPDGLDWARVNAIVPPMPEAEVHLTADTQYGGDQIHAEVTRLVRVTGEQRDVLKDREVLPDEGAGIYSSRTFTGAEITFSKPPVSSVEVRVESWDYETGYSDAAAEPSAGADRAGGAPSGGQAVRLPRRFPAVSADCLQRHL